MNGGNSFKHGSTRRVFIPHSGLREAASKTSNLLSNTQQLLQTEAWLSIVLENVDEAIVALDAAERIIFMNPAAERLICRTQDSCRGIPYGDIIKIEKDPRGIANHMLLRTGEGGLIPVLSRKTTVTSSVLSDVNEVIILHDLSAAEQIAQEREAIRERLRQAQRLESLGQLAAGIAHEINNPAGFMIGNLELLKDDVLGLVGAYTELRKLVADAAAGKPLPPDVTERVGKIEERWNVDRVLTDVVNMINEALKGADRIRRIVGSLRGFSRVDMENFAAVDIHEQIEKAIRLIPGDARKKAEFVRELGKISGVHGNANQLVQVIFNILMNACQAIEHDHGRITIKTFARDGHIFVEIADNGAGISQDILGNIFDPFFTTRKVGVGVGIGLFITYGIIKSHNGAITVSSKLGEGSTFTIKLPESAKTTT